MKLSIPASIDPEKQEKERAFARSFSCFSGSMEAGIDNFILFRKN